MRVAAVVLIVAVLTSACNPNAETNNPPVATGEAATERSTQAPAAGANSFTEDQARQRLVDNGFTNPSALMRGDDGLWRGQATKDGKTQDVAVDYQGNITP